MNTKVKCDGREISKGDRAKYIGNDNSAKQCVDCVFEGNDNFLCKCTDCVVYGNGNTLSDCKNCTVYGKVTTILDDCTDCREVNTDGADLVRVQVLENVRAGGSRIQLMKGRGAGRQTMSDVTCGGDVGQYMLS